MSVLMCFVLQSLNCFPERDMSTVEETCIEVVVALSLSLVAFRARQLLIVEYSRIPRQILAIKGAVNAIISSHVYTRATQNNSIAWI